MVDRGEIWVHYFCGGGFFSRASHQHLPLPDGRIFIARRKIKSMRLHVDSAQPVIALLAFSFVVLGLHQFDQDPEPP